MQCNIDARGKAARLAGGVISCAAGLIAALLWLSGLAGGWALAVGIALLALGGFAVFEGWAGWCALRAMGFKTPL